MLNLLKNWKTTIAGLVGGITLLLSQHPDEAKKLWGYLGSAAFVLLGLFAHDAKQDGK